MQVTPHVHAVHVDDTATAHPGGSNNYFIGDPGRGMVLIDAGTNERSWTRSILDFHRELGSPRVDAILITHGHHDHVGGLDRLQEAFGAQVRCHPRLVKDLGSVMGQGVATPLRSREVVPAGGVSLRALFTPGHAVDHVCFHLREEGVLFTGDTVLGSSSSTVSDLLSYMRSLELLARHRHSFICPAHGAVVGPPRGGRLIRWYMAHRQEREGQVLAALAKGIGDVPGIARDVYPRNLKKALRHAAEGNVRTHLTKLVKEGRVQEVSPTYSLVR